MCEIAPTSARRIGSNSLRDLPGWRGKGACAMPIFSILLLILMVLAIASLVKYLRRRP